MKFPLGAMTVGDILDRGLKLLLARLPAFYLINLIVLTPAILLQIAIPFVIESGGRMDQAALIAGAGVALFVVLITLILQPIGTAAILHIVMEEYAGRKVSIGEAFSFALTRFVPLIGASILVGLIVVLGLLACCGPGIYFAVAFAFVPQVVVLERKGAVESLSRSMQLVSGFWWRTFGVLLLIGIINGVIQAIVGFGLGQALPPQEVIQAEGGVRVKVNAGNHVVVTLITQLVAILFAIFQAVCTTLLYLDTRIRKEGFDLELASQLGEEPGGRGARDEYDEGDYDDRDDRDYDDRDDDDRDDRGRYGRR